MNDEFTRETTLAFNNNATDGYDLGLDAIAPQSNLPRDIFFPLDADKQYVISTLPFDIDKKMPIAFKADIPTTFKVSVNTLVNFDLAQEIFIHDKLTDVYYDIKNSFFSITLPPGINKTRFEITFKNDNSTLGLNDEVMASFEVFQNNDNQELTIFNALQKELYAVELYDVTGKLVINKTNLGSSEHLQISTSGLSNGVYFVKLLTQDNVSVAKKIAISRK